MHTFFISDLIQLYCCRLPSWWWTLSCSKHVDDNTVELNHWRKKVCILLVLLTYV